MLLKNRSYSHMDVLSKASITLQIIEDVAIYKAQIFSSNGNIFGSTDKSSEVSVVVYKGLEDITSKFNDIVWRKFSVASDKYEEDLAWGEAHKNKTSFTLLKEDIDTQAKIQVEVYTIVNGERALAATDYVSFIDINDMQGSTTPPDNPKHGDLWLDTSVIPPRLMMWDNNLKQWVEVAISGKDRRNLIRNSNFYKADTSHWENINEPALEIESLNGKKWARIKSTANANLKGIKQKVLGVPKADYSFQILSGLYPQSLYPEGNLLISFYSISKDNTRTLIKEITFDITSTAKVYTVSFNSFNDTNEIELNITGERNADFDFMFTNIKLENYKVCTEWELAIEDIQDALDNKVGNTHDEVFGSLTDDGRLQGIYTDVDDLGNKNFYFNASYIKTGKLLGERIEAKNLVVTHEAGHNTLAIDSQGNIEIKARRLSVIVDDDLNRVEDVATTSQLELKVQKNDVIASINLYTQDSVDENGQTISGVRISGDKIDINGKVTFSSLAKEGEGAIANIFAQQGDTTVIDGGMIKTNTIIGNDLNLKGNLSITKNENGIIRTTFAIKDTGDIEVDGILKSANFSEENNLGYKIDTDGTAILNQATIKGSVQLLNAGMTNFGDKMGNPNIAKGTIEQKVIIGNNAANQCVVLGTLEKNIIDTRRVSVSFKYKIADYESGKFKLQSSGDYWISLSKEITPVQSEDEEYSTYSTTVNIPADKTISGLQVRLDNFIGTLGIYELKVEFGDVSTPWCPHVTEQSNFVRIWAGDSFINRANAPFRVMQNGDVFAKNCILSGTLIGALENDKLHIRNSSIIINNETAYITDEGKLLRNKAEAPFTTIQLAPNMAMFNTDVIFGGANESEHKLYFSNKNSIFNFKNADFNFTGNQSNIKMNKTVGELGGLNLIAVAGGGHHVVRHSTAEVRKGSLIFSAEGGQASFGDFVFTRKNHKEQVKVRVEGEMNIDNKITSNNNNIEMKSIPGKGWGFYAR